MKIETVQKYPKLKSIAGNKILCLPDLDMVVAVDFSLRNLGFYSISTGKEVHVHRLAKYSTISGFHRQGRWLFLDYNDAGAASSLTVSGAFDLESMVFLHWHEVLGNAIQKKYYSGSTERFAYFKSTWDENSTWFAFRLSDGELVVGPAELQYADYVRCFAPGFVYTSIKEQEHWRDRAYEMDSNGFPTKIRIWEDTKARAMVAVWDGHSFLASSKNKQCRVECLTSRFASRYTIEFPDRDDSIEAGASEGALTLSKDDGGLGAFHRTLEDDANLPTWNRRQQVIGVEMETGKTLWDRTIVMTRSDPTFLADKKIIVHDKEGIDAVDLETGDLQRISFPQVRCLSGCGAYLGGTDNQSRSGCAPVPANPYFFWQTEVGKPMMLGRIVE
jgi:hypothetical protein